MRRKKCVVQEHGEETQEVGEKPKEKAVGRNAECSNMLKSRGKYGRNVESRRMLKRRSK